MNVRSTTPFPQWSFTTRIEVTRRITLADQLLNIPLYNSSAGQRTFYDCTMRICSNLGNTLD